LEEETGLRMDNVIIGRGDESYICVMGKGRKSRTVGLGNDTRLALMRYMHRERGHSTCPYFFLAQRDEPWSVRMLQQFLGKLGEISGVEHVHAHKFRHTFAVRQLLSGTSDLVLMRLLGHTTLDSTKIYIRAMTDIQARKAAPSIMDMLRKNR
jgi:site-specific recombinase XerD